MEGRGTIAITIITRTHRMRSLWRSTPKTQSFHAMRSRVLPRYAEIPYLGPLTRLWRHHKLIVSAAHLGPIRRSKDWQTHSHCLITLFQFLYACGRLTVCSSQCRWPLLSPSSLLPPPLSLSLIFLFPPSAGVVALLVEASHFTLTARDVSHILVRSAYHPPHLPWRVNGGGHKHHPIVCRERERGKGRETETERERQRERGREKFRVRVRHAKKEKRRLEGGNNLSEKESASRIWSYIIKSIRASSQFFF